MHLERVLLTGPWIVCACLNNCLGRTFDFLTGHGQGEIYMYHQAWKEAAGRKEIENFCDAN